MRDHLREKTVEVGYLAQAERFEDVLFLPDEDRHDLSVKDLALLGQAQDLAPRIGRIGVAGQ